MEVSLAPDGQTFLNAGPRQFVTFWRTFKDPRRRDLLLALKEAKTGSREEAAKYRAYLEDKIKGLQSTVKSVKAGSAPVADEAKAEPEPATADTAQSAVVTVVSATPASGVPVQVAAVAAQTPTAARAKTPAASANHPARTMEVKSAKPVQHTAAVPKKAVVAKSASTAQVAVVQPTVATAAAPAPKPDNKPRKSSVRSQDFDLLAGDVMNELGQMGQVEVPDKIQEPAEAKPEAPSDAERASAITPPPPHAHKVEPGPVKHVPGRLIRKPAHPPPPPGPPPADAPPAKASPKKPLGKVRGRGRLPGAGVKPKRRRSATKRRRSSTKSAASPAPEKPAAPVAGAGASPNPRRRKRRSVSKGPRRRSRAGDSKADADVAAEKRGAKATKAKAGVNPLAPTQARKRGTSKPRRANAEAGSAVLLPGMRGKVSSKTSPAKPAKANHSHHHRKAQQKRDVLAKEMKAMRRNRSEEGALLLPYLESTSGQLEDAVLPTALAGRNAKRNGRGAKPSVRRLAHTFEAYGCLPKTPEPGHARMPKHTKNTQSLPVLAAGRPGKVAGARKKKSSSRTQLPAARRRR